MQAEEQEKLSIEEKSKLFVQLLEARKKHFAVMRAQEMRNKPPTKVQKRNTMSTYLKNMAGYKHNQLKNKSFDDIQKLFDKAMKRVNTFVDMNTELVEGSKVRAEGSETRVEGSSKRAGEELEQESSKKQKLEDDKETTELQRLIEVVPDKEEVEIDAIPLATKPPSIVDWKIHKEGKKIYYQIIRADGSSKMYLVFSHMLKSFDREDLETLYKLVKAKYGSTRPVEDLDLVLYGDLTTMFDPYVEDQVWKNQLDYRVLDWKLYDSCGLSMKKLEILKKNIKFRGGLLGLKNFLLIFELLLLRAARQMSLSVEVRIRAEFNIREKRRLSSFSEAAEAVHLRAKASKFEVVEKSLQDEIKYLKERNTALEKEKGVLDVRVADLAATVKVREQKAADSDAMITTVKLQNDRLADQVRELETSSAGLQEKVVVYENCMSQLKKFQDEQMAVVHEKYNKLDADFIETCLHLE
ncbi:hypothetical protein Tco_0711811, partial [Tanacetum coccineum]